MRFEFKYDLAGVPNHLRVRARKEMVAEWLSRSATDHQLLDDDFAVAVKGWRSGDLVFVETSSSKCLVERTPQLAREATEETVLFGIGLDHPVGSVQDGRESAIAAGDAALVMNDRPYTLAVGDSARFLGMQIPKRELMHRIGPIDDLTAMTFSSKLPLQEFAARFFIDLAKVVDHVDDAVTQERLIAQGLDLLALAMSEQLGGSLQNTTMHRSTSLFRLKTLIVSKLKDSNFSLADAAAAFGVSPRYINSLLATQATSFGRFILEKRLEACRRDLANPRHSSTNIIDVAFRWGFNDPAHFSRTFKARFGRSPRDFQRQCLLDRQSEAKRPLIA